SCAPTSSRERRTSCAPRARPAFRPPSRCARSRRSSAAIPEGGGSSSPTGAPRIPSSRALALPIVGRGRARVTRDAGPAVRRGGPGPRGWERMSLVGSLEDLGLADILQIMSLSRKSGVLVLRGEDGEGRIVFRDGLVHAARLKGEAPDLDTLVRQAGLSAEAGPR